MYQHLISDDPIMQTRACWVYQKYGNFEFTNPDHLRAACNKICEHLYSPHMPVKVEAALAISQKSAQFDLR